MSTSFLKIVKTFSNTGNCDSKQFFTTNFCKNYLDWSLHMHECFKIVQHKNVCFQLNVVHFIIPKATSRNFVYSMNICIGELQPL